MTGVLLLVSLVMLDNLEAIRLVLLITFCKAIMKKSLVYQSKYSYSGTPIDAKSTIDGSTLRLCLPRGGFTFYANVAIKIFLLFLTPFPSSYWNAS